MSFLSISIPVNKTPFSQSSWISLKNATTKLKLDDSATRKYAWGVKSVFQYLVSVGTMCPKPAQRSRDHTPAIRTCLRVPLMVQRAWPATYQRWDVWLSRITRCQSEYILFAATFFEASPSRYVDEKNHIT